MKRAPAICAAALAGALLLAAKAYAFTVVPAQGVKPGEIVVGSLLDLTGPLSSEGTSIKNGLTMAFDEINAQGGVLGRKIKLKVEDSGYNPLKARADADKLLADGVFAILCSDGTPVVSASMPVILNHGVLHLFPFAPADATYIPSQPLEFAVDLPVADQIHQGLDALLNERGRLKVGVLARDDEFGHAAITGAEAALAARKRHIIETALFEPGTHDFSEELKKLRRSGAELVVVGAVAQDAFKALAEAHARGWYPVFLCPDACYAPDVATLGGRALSGLYAVGTTPIPYPDSADAHMRDWVRRYEGRFISVASAPALRAYLDARLFAEALRRSGPHPTQLYFARALEAMPAWSDPDFGGLPIKYGAKDHLGLHESFLAQIRGGRWLILGR